MNIVFFYPFKFCCCVFAPLLPNVFQCKHPRICCTLRALSDIFVLSLLLAPSELYSSSAPRDSSATILGSRLFC